MIPKKHHKIVQIFAAIFAIVALAAIVEVFYIQPQAQANNGVETVGANIKGISQASVVFRYSDGTYSPPITSSSSQTNQAAIINSGKTITSINTNLNMIPSFSGSIKSYSINAGTFTVTIKDSAGNTVYSGNVPVSPISPLPALTSGQSTIVCSSTANANTAPFTNQIFTAGQTYTLIDTISGFSIQGSFNDGTTFGPIQAANAQVSWTFQYQSSNTFNGVSLNFALSTS